MSRKKTNLMFVEIAVGRAAFPHFRIITALTIIASSQTMEIKRTQLVDTYIDNESPVHSVAVQLLIRNRIR